MDAQSVLATDGRDLDAVCTEWRDAEMHLSFTPEDRDLVKARDASSAVIRSATDADTLSALNGLQFIVRLLDEGDLDTALLISKKLLRDARKMPVARAMPIHKQAVPIHKRVRVAGSTATAKGGLRRPPGRPPAGKWWNSATGVYE